MNNKDMKVPLIRLAKREDISKGKALLFRFLGVVGALIVCAILIFILVQANPIKVYLSMFKGAFGTDKKIWVTLRDTMALLCIAVGLAPAFKMKFWNIGAEGQILMGGVVSAALMIYAGDAMPNWLLLIVMAVCSMIAGAVWGIIPAIFKSKWETNETLFTLMMNYVAIQITSFCVSKWENPPGSNSVGVINLRSEAGWFPAIFGKAYVLNVIIVMAITVAMYFYLKYSKHGYEIAVVGESQNTARYAGISVSKVFMRTMLLSGAICSLTGFVTVAGAGHTISTSTGGGRGFTAIIVAWLSKFNTFVMIAFSLLIVALQKGAIQIASEYNLNGYASEMITGIVLFFILGTEFFLNYRLIFRKNAEKEENK